MRTLMTFVLLAAALGAFASAMGNSSEIKGAGRKGMGILGVVLLCLAAVASSYMSVPAGYRGVLLRFGAVHGVLDEGFHLVTPVIHSVVLMDVRTQKSSAKAAAASKDLQTVQSEVAVNYHISPAEVGNLYKRVGVFYEERVIEPAVQETLKAVVANYTAGNLIQYREKVKAQVDSALSKRLEYYNIIVEPGGVSLTNFDFSAEFNAAIEAKQVAQQDAEKQKYILNRAQTEAQTAITIAKGEAEANRVKAIALNSSGGQKVLAREWIQKWDGKLPTVSGGGNQNMIDLRSLMGPEPAKK